MKITPYSIQNIMEQLRHGMVGTLAYVGGHELFFNHPSTGRDRECRSSFRSHCDENGTLKYEVGLGFRVKGKPGEDWQMVIAYEPDDTYTVWLLRDCAPSRRAGAGTMCEVVLCLDDVSDENLQQAVESIYDEAFKIREQEFAPLTTPSQARSDFIAGRARI
jgi:hypothetical protein